MIKALTVIARAFRVLLFQHLTLINLIETYCFQYCFMNKFSQIIMAPQNQTSLLLTVLNHLIGFFRGKVMSGPAKLAHPIAIYTFWCVALLSLRLYESTNPPCRNVNNLKNMALHHRDLLQLQELLNVLLQYRPHQTFWAWCNGNIFFSLRWVLIYRFF